MNEPIRQHYIPRSYLKHFTEQDKNSLEKIYVRRKGEEKPFETTTKNICVQKDLYTIPDLGTDKKYSIEMFYGDTADSYFPEIHDLLVDESVTTIDIETRRKIISAALSLYFRTPKFLNVKNRMVEDIIQEIAITSKSEDISITYFGEELRFKRDEAKKVIKEAKEKNRILFLSQHLEAYKRFVDAKIMNGICIYKVVDDAEFVTSDNPVIIRHFVDPTSPNYDENEYFSQPINPFDPLNMIHLPIDKKHILTIMPNMEDTDINRIHRQSITLFDVLMYNSDMERYSESWVIGTKKAILSHIEDQVTYNIENDANTKMLEDYKFRALSLKEFYETAERYGINSIQFRDKANELAENDIIKSDPSFSALLEEIRSIMR